MKLIKNIFNKQRTISGKMTLENIANTFNISHLIINAVNVKILQMVNNPQVTNVQSIQVGTSETIRSLSEEENN